MSPMNQQVLISTNSYQEIEAIKRSRNLHEEYNRVELASALPRNLQLPLDILFHHKDHVSQNEYAIQSMILRSPASRLRSHCLHIYEANPN